MESNLSQTTYNITGQPMLAKEVAQSIIDITNSKSKIRFVDAEKTQPQKTIVSDFVPEKTLEDRLKEHIGVVYGY